MRIDKIVLNNFGSYEGETVFDTSTENGRNIILVGGKNGAGKTTSIRILMNVFPADRGEVLIDGKPIDSLNLSQYRHHISVVPQNSILFSGSIPLAKSIAYASYVRLRSVAGSCLTVRACWSTTLYIQLYSSCSSGQLRTAPM